MTAQIPKFLTERLWYGHSLAATVGAMSVGFIPAAMMERWTLNTHLDTIGFPIPPVALVLGYILARKYPCSAAIWVWVPPLLFFAWDAHPACFWLESAVVLQVAMARCLRQPAWNHLCLRRQRVPRRTVCDDAAYKFDLLFDWSGRIQSSSFKAFPNSLIAVNFAEQPASAAT